MKVVVDFGYAESVAVSVRDAAAIIAALEKAMVVTHDYKDSSYTLQPMKTLSVAFKLVPEHSIKKPTELPGAILAAREEIVTTDSTNQVNPLNKGMMPF